MTNEMEQRWAELTAHFRPSAPRAVVDGNDVVRPGQIREAVWDQCEATVLVNSVDDTTAEVTVNPMSLEPGVADARAVILDGHTSPMRCNIAIWPNINATMSFVVLHHAIAELPEDVLRSVRAANLQDCVHHEHGGRSRFSGTPLPGSGAALAIDELLDSIDVLASVRPRRTNAVNPQQMAKFPLGLSALMATLEITQAAAMAVIKGHRALTSDQAEAVARVANVPVAEVLAAAHPLPDDLVRELMEPRWRSAIRSRAAAGDEAEAREELGRSAFALAARGKGSGRELWRQRIQAVLAADSV